MKLHVPIFLAGTLCGIPALTIACTPAPPDEGQSSTESPLSEGASDDCQHGMFGVNQRFCGRSSGTTDTLYQCVNGTWFVSEKCSSGCEISSAVGADKCKAKAKPPAAAAPDPNSCGQGAFDGRQTFCGRSPGTENTLYSCVDGAWSVVENCASRCSVSSTLGGDFCVREQPKSKPPDTNSCGQGAFDGRQTFCGRSPGTENTLYRCVDGAWSVVESCANRCSVSSTLGGDFCVR